AGALGDHDRVRAGQPDRDEAAGPMTATEPATRPVTGPARRAAGPAVAWARGTGWYVRRVLLYLLLLALAGVFIGPFLILLSAATKPATQDVFSFPPDLLPRPPVFDYFVEAWTTIPYGQFLVNS